MRRGRSDRRPDLSGAAAARLIGGAGPVLVWHRSQPAVGPTCYRPAICGEVARARLRPEPRPAASNSRAGCGEFSEERRALTLASIALAVGAICPSGRSQLAWERSLTVGSAKDHSMDRAEVGQSPRTPLEHTRATGHGTADAREGRRTSPSLHSGQAFAPTTCFCHREGEARSDPHPRLQGSSGSLRTECPTPPGACSHRHARAAVSLNH